MIKKNKKQKNNNLINLSEIPLSSSLGLLAYGDLAFEAWRELKTKHNIEKENEKK